MTTTTAIILTVAVMIVYIMALRAKARSARAEAIINEHLELVPILSRYYTPGSIVRIGQNDVLAYRSKDAARADAAEAALQRVTKTINECSVDAALAINPSAAATVLKDARARIGARIDAEDAAKIASKIGEVSG